MNTVTILILVATIFIVLINLFYKKVIFISLSLINILFIISIIGIISALFLPSIYISTAELLFKDNAFGNSLLSIENFIEQIANIPSNIGNSIQNLIGRGSDSGTSFDSNLYNDFIKLISGILRIFSIVLSLIILVITTYFKYVYSGFISSRKLEKRVEELEQKLAAVNNG